MKLVKLYNEQAVSLFRNRQFFYVSIEQQKSTEQRTEGNKRHRSTQKQPVEHADSATQSKKNKKIIHANKDVKIYTRILSTSFVLFI